MIKPLKSGHLRGKRNNCLTIDDDSWPKNNMNIDDPKYNDPLNIKCNFDIKANLIQSLILLPIIILVAYLGHISPNVRMESGFILGIYFTNFLYTYYFYLGKKYGMNIK